MAGNAPHMGPGGTKPTHTHTHTHTHTSWEEGIPDQILHQAQGREELAVLLAGDEAGRRAGKVQAPWRAEAAEITRDPPAHVAHVPPEDQEVPGAAATPRSSHRQQLSRAR